jgi:putative DNA primase/helicase
MKAKDMAAGKWRPILAMLGIPAEVLDGRHHKCPANGQGEDRFRFADRNGSGNYFCACSAGDKGGMALLMCCQGLSYAEAAKEVERVAEGANAAPIKPKRDPREALNRIRTLVRPAGKSVRDYLASRNLDVPPGVRQARLVYWHERKRLGDFDCMVALVSSAQAKPLTYHVTYLQDGQKADVPCARKVMPPVATITGGAIRLYPVAEEMGVAEGIETAIAATMLTGIPTWAAVSAGGVESFQPPARCKRLVVFGDNDTTFTGQAAAYALAKRLKLGGMDCEVRIPDRGDWADRSAA